MKGAELNSEKFNTEHIKELSKSYTWVRKKFENNQPYF